MALRMGYLSMGFKYHVNLARIEEVIKFWIFSSISLSLANHVWWWMLCQELHKVHPHGREAWLLPSKVHLAANERFSNIRKSTLDKRLGFALEVSKSALQRIIHLQSPPYGWWRRSWTPESPPKQCGMKLMKSTLQGFQNLLKVRPSNSAHEGPRRQESPPKVMSEGA